MHWILFVVEHDIHSQLFCGFFGKWHPMAGTQGRQAEANKHEQRKRHPDTRKPMRIPTRMPELVSKHPKKWIKKLKK